MPERRAKSPITVYTAACARDPSRKGRIHHRLARIPDCMRRFRIRRLRRRRRRRWARGIVVSVVFRLSPVTLTRAVQSRPYTPDFVELPYRRSGYRHPPPEGQGTWMSPDANDKSASYATHSFRDHFGYPYTRTAAFFRCPPLHNSSTLESRTVSNEFLVLDSRAPTIGATGSMDISFGLAYDGVSGLADFVGLQASGGGSSRAAGTIRASYRRILVSGGIESEEEHSYYSRSTCCYRRIGE
jgi:hypothetical protein